MSTLGQIEQADRGPKFPLDKARGPHLDQNQDGKNIRAERETKDRDTQKLIVEVAERLFRQYGFQKTTVADIARDLHMSPANVYRFFTAKSEINEEPPSRLAVHHSNLGRSAPWRRPYREGFARALQGLERLPGRPRITLSLAATSLLARTSLE
jgi:AcrR family transcriptional regulator